MLNVVCLSKGKEQCFQARLKERFELAAAGVKAGLTDLCWEKS